MRTTCSLVLGLCLLVAPAAARADGEGPPPGKQPAKQPAGPVTLEVRGEREVLQKAADALGQQTGATGVAWEGEVLRLTFASAEAAEKARALCKELGLKVRKPKAPGEGKEGKGDDGKEGERKGDGQDKAREPEASKRPVIEGRVFDAGPEQLEQAVQRLKEAFPSVKARVQEGVLVLAARERKEFDGAVALLGTLGLRVAEPRGPQAGPRGPGGPGMPGMDGRGVQVQMSPERAAGLRIDGLERRLVEARQAGREREVAELERALDQARKAMHDLRAHREEAGRGGERGGERDAEGPSELERLRQRMDQAREAFAQAEQRDARRREQQRGEGRPGAMEPEARLRHAREALEHLQAAGMDGLAQMVRAAIGRMEQGLQRMAQGREAMAQRMRQRQGPPEGMGPRGAGPQGMGPQGMGPRGMDRRGMAPGMGGRGPEQGPPPQDGRRGPQGPPPPGTTWGRLPPGAPPSVGGVRRGQIFLPHPVPSVPEAPPPAPRAGPQGPPAPGERRGMGMEMGMQMGPREGMQRQRQGRGRMQDGPQGPLQGGPQGPGPRGPQDVPPRGMQRGPQGPQAGPQGELEALRREVEELRKQLRYLLMERLDRPQGR